MWTAAGQVQYNVKTGILAPIAAFLLLVPWFVTSGPGGVTVDGIVRSAVIVMALAVAFSIISQLAFSAIYRHITACGIALSIITGAALVIPFLNVLGPVAGIIVGVAGGFAAFLLQKTATSPRKGKPLAAAAATLATTYLVLVIVIVSVHQGPWDAGDGIGSWSGTPDGVESPGLIDIFGSGNLLALFPIVILALATTIYMVCRR